MPHRPRRSVLYMPGSNLRALDKAKTLPADTLILDLEDAVSPDAKALARQQVVASIQAGGYGNRELVVRVNGLDTDWGMDDIRAVATSGANAICLPKVEAAAEVEELVRLLDDAGAPETMKIWIMSETPKGVLNINEVAASHWRLAVIVMGTSDLAKDLRVPHTPDRLGFLTSLGLCLLAARANNVDILDGVYLDLDDEPGYRASCVQGRELGFDGKTLIHPKQLSAANEVFGPSADELTRCEKIIAAWAEAEAGGQGVVLVDGKLVESLHVEEARRLLVIAAEIDKLQVS